MSKMSKPVHDRFTFSLGGMRTISPFAVAVAIADDQINKARDARLREPQEDQPREPRAYPGIKGRFWLLRRRTA